MLFAAVVTEQTDRQKPRNFVPSLTFQQLPNTNGAGNALLNKKLDSAMY